MSTGWNVKTPPECTKGVKLIVITRNGDETVYFNSDGLMDAWWKWPVTHRMLHQLFVKHALEPCECVVRVRTENGPAKAKLFFDSIGHLDRIETMT